MDEKEASRLATIKANKDPMGFHADSCPRLISNGRLNCTCSCYSFAKGKYLRGELKR